MNKLPLISVIIPTRSSGSRIEIAIESILKQTYRNLEVLVIDDHNKNDIKGIVAKFAQSDPRIQYHLLPYEDKKRTHILPHRTQGWRKYDINGGYLARNYGFSLAKGEYIVLQDADDASFLNKIEVQYNLAKKYGATLIATQWMQLKDEYLNKTIDVDMIFREIGEDNIVIRPEVITEMAKRNKGILMSDWFPHRYVPFIFKWFPLTRPLFFSGFDNYPGADNSMLFKRDVLKKVMFRKRDDRVWPNPYGRGSGRDFTFQVAETFQNSWTFKLPLYLWRATSGNPDFNGYEKYIK